MREHARALVGQVELAAACMSLCAAVPASSKDEYPFKVNVFVRGAAHGGFVEGDVADSVKDLRGNLDGKKVIQLVPDAGSADIVITVVGRGNEETGRTIYRSHSSRHSYRSSSSKETVKVVRAVLQVGRYELPMLGVDDLWWGHAASNLGKRIEKWIKGNYEQIQARRTNKDATFSNAGADSEEGDQ
jgi:hypothetical protein